MPNGRFGDNPLTDLFHHGRHSFPADMEEMLLELRQKWPAALQELDSEPFQWEQGDVEEGRAWLKAKVAQLSLSLIKGCVPVDGDTYDVPMQIATVEERIANIYRRKFGDEESQKDLPRVRISA